MGNTGSEGGRNGMSKVGGGRGEGASQLVCTGRVCILLSHSMYMCIFLLLSYSLHTQHTRKTFEAAVEAYE